jgi:hypothetical protein
VQSPQELRDMARRCRFMTSASLQPSVNKQLWLWAAELADYADEIERCAEAPGRSPAKAGVPGCSADREGS